VRHLGLFAREELVLALRSRWTQIFAVVFGVLSFAVAFSVTCSPAARRPGLRSTAVSLVQLVLLLVPADGARDRRAVAGAGARGRRADVLGQPVSRSTILLGKLAGGCSRPWARSQLVGFGAAGLVIYAQSGSEGLGGFLLLVGRLAGDDGHLLGLAALLSPERWAADARARLALALVVWSWRSRSSTSSRWVRFAAALRHGLARDHGLG